MLCRPRLAIAVLAVLFGEDFLFEFGNFVIAGG
jgi:hypothetical protein